MLQKRYFFLQKLREKSLKSLRKCLNSALKFGCSGFKYPYFSTRSRDQSAENPVNSWLM